MELLGSSAPEPFLRKAMRGSSCMRRAVNERFVLSSPLGMIFNFLSSKYFFYKYDQETKLSLCYEYLTFLKSGSILDLKHLIIVLNVGF